MTERRHASGAARVQCFVDSQRGLAPLYAAEGKQIAAAWTNQVVGDVGDSRPQSPILVPRAAPVLDDNEHRATAVHSASNDCEQTPQRPPHLAPGSSSQMGFNHSKSLLEKINPGTSGHVYPKSVNRDLALDDASERSKRLEQRRNRRRAQRSTLTVAEEESNSETASHEGHTSQPKKKQKKDVPKTKPKKAVPALLLMQTFSGQNMGKSRLTQED
ncbi:hypothetical protein RhiJN_19099 [Ceratobasidium sp. AG-Ba]|nr:hypothetical protein RhiJN_04277 [Ceratobasidium sp. AG-Ba]QRV91081.1 hypothetical protein RhiJN_19099 [Ceratobasidium sp. AG-Ba]